MTDKHKRVIEISSDTENAVEQVINQLYKSTSEAKRYGVDISVRRVDVEGKEVVGFDE